MIVPRCCRRCSTMSPKPSRCSTPSIASSPGTTNFAPFSTSPTTSWRGAPRYADFVAHLAERGDFGVGVGGHRCGGSRAHIGARRAAHRRAHASRRPHPGVPAQSARRGRADPDLHRCERAAPRRLPGRGLRAAATHHPGKGAGRARRHRAGGRRGQAGQCALPQAVRPRRQEAPGRCPTSRSM